MTAAMSKSKLNKEQTSTIEPGYGHGRDELGFESRERHEYCNHDHNQGQGLKMFNGR